MQKDQGIDRKVKASGWFVPALRYSSLNDVLVITSKKPVETA